MSVAINAGRVVMILTKIPNTLFARIVQKLPRQLEIVALVGVILLRARIRSDHQRQKLFDWHFTIA